MNFETRDKEPDAKKEEALFISGREIGWIITRSRADREGLRYHAGINVGPGDISLIQGHGATKEEAVLEALRRGREGCNCCLAKIDDLEKVLGVSTGPALPMDAPSE